MTRTDVDTQGGAHMDAELSSQPEVWARAIAQARTESLLPADGARVAVIGCGTSWFMAQSYAVAREAAGRGVTDAFAASEAFLGSGRSYDAVVAITRSGATTEVLEILALRRHLYVPPGCKGMPAKSCRMVTRWYPLACNEEMRWSCPSTALAWMSCWRTIDPAG